MNSGKFGRNEPSSDLDADWIDLIVTAQTMGIPLEEIRHFLEEGAYLASPDKKDT
jgi:DNA-binding transcriptional MerR regulator